MQTCRATALEGTNIEDCDASKVIILIVVGVVLWLVNAHTDVGPIKKLMIAVVLWLLNLFGLLESRLNIHVGQ